jgi:hypothetical protein
MKGAMERLESCCVESEKMDDRWCKVMASDLRQLIELAKCSVPVSSLVCVGKARFNKIGGDVWPSWFVQDAVDTGGFRYGQPANKELLFVIPASAKRAIAAAPSSKEQV